MRPFFWRHIHHQTIPLTDEIIQQVETILGIKLPESYLEIMRTQNGGTMRYDVFPLPDGEKWLWIDALEPILPEPPENWDGITASSSLIEEWQMPSGLVLLAGDGHVWLALDYRQVNADGEPGVVYIDNEVTKDEEREIRLTETFAEFLDRMVDGNSCDVVGIISKGKPPEGMAAQLNQLLGINLVKTKFPGLATIYYEDKNPPWDLTSKTYKHWLRLERNHQSGYSYPMFTEHDWLFSYEVKDAHLADEIFKKIADGFDYEVIKIHTPLFR